MRAIPPRFVVPNTGWGDEYGIVYDAAQVLVLTSTSAAETYAGYNPASVYATGARVFDSAGNTIKESTIDFNQGYPLDNSPYWVNGGKAGYLEPLKWTGRTYSAGELIGVAEGGGKVGVYRSAQDANTGNAHTNPIWWERIGVTYEYYSNTRDYAIGWGVTDTDKNIYFSQLTPNIGRPLTQGDVWQTIAPSNKRAMFDYIGSTRTVATSPLVVTLSAGKRIDSIDLSGMVNVQTVRIQMTSGGSPVYDQTITLQKRNVSNWYSFFFAPFSFKKSTVKFDLPPYSNSIITVTFTSASGNVEVGSLMIGSQFYIGQTQYNATRDYVNYSTVTREFDGSISKMVQRPGIPKTRQTVWFEKENAQAVSEFLRSVDATPIAISGIDDATDGYFEPIHIVGFIKSAPIDLAHPARAICNIEVEAISPN